MIKTIISVVVGLVTWFVVATALNLLLRVALPGYHEAEPSMQFTLGMMIARLVLGAISTLAAGFATAWVAMGNEPAVKILGVLLIVCFIPVHYGLWNKFPLWYHLTFLVSLFPLTLLGALLKRQRAATL
jgi:hypothetical protein